MSEFLQKVSEGVEHKKYGFHEKVAKHIKEKGSIKPSGKNWTVSIGIGLDGRKLKTPIVVTTKDRLSAMDAATVGLLSANADKSKKGQPAMVPVESSNLKAVGYNEDTKTLYITFKQGATYMYEGVPMTKAMGLMNASSHGTYFAANIRDDYATTKLV